MNTRHLILLAVAGLAGPIFAQAAEFSLGGTPAFAQNIVEPATSFPAGGDLLPEPVNSRGDDFGTAIVQSDIRAKSTMEVSVDADTGHLPDTASSRRAGVGASGAGVVVPVVIPVIDPLDSARRPSYRWQSLVPGVLK